VREAIDTSFLTTGQGPFDILLTGYLLGVLSSVALYAIFFVVADIFRSVKAMKMFLGE
jgi:hypothetical protein